MLGELTPTEVEEVLRAGVIGRIGCISSGRPYVVPVCYAYDEGSVYGHSVEGMKLRALRDTPQVCFEVEDVKNLSNWRSVIAWGTAEELSGPAADDGMRLLVERVMPLLASNSASAHPSPSGAHLAASVFRIRLHDSTGRFESTTP
jgi:nitroimidazol reductase NimA-like FMN-containing flavoprotein (pyridoxamine 5'-phosphate oxidase superfamily)